ncbi:methylmalonyl Co-A mutase-associated GTPase MeaB [Pseudoneobacillus sp. C159]
MSGRFKKREGGSSISVSELFEGILRKDRSSLARAITLIESNAEKHFTLAQELLHMLLPFTGGALRIGITGVPGAGKSTFIEAIGMHLCNLGLRVAVLAVDPSSSISGGSILGDKTRMEQLSKQENAFIRPSPSEGKLGGIHRKTRETMLLCEAAGYDVILVETVGVGQSEALIRDMVDFFLMLVLTGAGDELQGMKKGIMELVDAIVVNKADGDNKPLALKTKKEYTQILHFLHPVTPGWTTKAFTCSALHFEGVAEIWEVILEFEQKTKASGIFDERRRKQVREWLHAMISDQLHLQFFGRPEVKNALHGIEQAVMDGEKTVTTAVMELFNDI